MQYPAAGAQQDQGCNAIKMRGNTICVGTHREEINIFLSGWCETVWKHHFLTTTALVGTRHQTSENYKAFPLQTDTVSPTEQKLQCVQTSKRCNKMLIIKNAGKS